MSDAIKRAREETDHEIYQYTRDGLVTDDSEAALAAERALADAHIATLEAEVRGLLRNYEELLAETKTPEEQAQTIRSCVCRPEENVRCAFHEYLDPEGRMP